MRQPPRESLRLGDNRFERLVGVLGEVGIELADLGRLGDEALIGLSWRSRSGSRSPFRATSPKTASRWRRCRSRSSSWCSRSPRRRSPAQPLESEAKLFRPVSMNSLPNLPASSNVCVMVDFLPSTVGVGALLCNARNILCTAQKVKRPNARCDTADRRTAIRIKLEQKDERSGYHKRIGNADRLICAECEAGTFAASGATRVKGCNSASGVGIDS